MAARALVTFIKSNGGKAVVITGAGCSTESGIPDYRGPNGKYRHADFKPLTLQRFIRCEEEQKRYWARSMLGYSTMSGASCNAAHMALHALHARQIVTDVITQNVDGLHHLAGNGGRGDAVDMLSDRYIRSQDRVHEIHGNIHRVQCMSCGDVSRRAELQDRLRQSNSELYARFVAGGEGARPDGDFAFPEDAVHQMKLVRCEQCGGSLKPHVVLFGENVPRAIVDQTLQIVRSAPSLICVGTTLTVYSAFRYVSAAVERGTPVAIVNAGVTRADSVASVKIETKSAAETLSGAAALLLGSAWHA